MKPPRLAALALNAAVSYAQTEDECGVFQHVTTCRIGSSTFGTMTATADSFTLGRVREYGSRKMGCSQSRTFAKAGQRSLSGSKRITATGSLGTFTCSLPRPSRCCGPCRSAVVQNTPPGAYGPTLQVTMYAGEIPGSPGAAGIAYSSSSGPYGVGLPNVVTLENDGSPVLRDGVARVLLHEFAHVLDNQIAVDAVWWAEGAGWGTHPVFRRPCLAEGDV